MWVLEQINCFVWGIPALFLIIGIGVFFSIRTKFLQIRLLPQALGLFFRKIFQKQEGTGGVSSVQALCTALAATVGTGNLAGVAGAIAIGGPGSIFWMWICALLGMVTKYAEVTLAVKYRSRNTNGEYVGGPMYMIRNGMGKRWLWLAYLYSFFGVVAAFGVGNATQINTLIGGINRAAAAYGASETQFANLMIGIALAIMIAGILLGGLRKIGKIAERLVPLAAIIYIALCIGLLVARIDRIPDAFYQILRGAFCPQAVTGGAIGSVYSVLRIGASRGVFTNEAGMGTASIAHCAAEVRDPHEQGLMGIVEVFLDTIVICTLTGLAILCSGIDIPYGTDIGIVLTSEAFQSVFGDWVGVLIAAVLCCLAIATVIGWGLYGVRGAQFLFGDNVYPWFVLLQAVTVVIAALLRTDTVWILSEIVNGLMAIPNMIALIALGYNRIGKNTKIDVVAKNV